MWLSSAVPSFATKHGTFETFRLARILMTMRMMKYTSTEKLVGPYMAASVA